MIGGLRYAFLGQSDVNIYVSFGILLFFITILVSVILYLLKKGY
jgi:ABC-2 type transport system permease protein